MSCRLVCDFPDAADAQQIMEIDPSICPARRIIEAKLNRCGVSSLGHRDEASHDPFAGWRRPLFETFGYQVLVQFPFGVDVKDPGVFMKGLLQHGHVIFVERVHIEAHNANDRILVVCSLCHRNLP
jgi:hypothetical protein